MSQPFEIITTDDGSPTIRPTGGEAMHSLRGAISETEYCYAQPWRAAHAQGASSLMVVGLGLAAIEMLVSSHPPDRLHSFEAEPALRGALVAWLEGKSAPLAEAYAAMASAAAKNLNRETDDIRLQLAQFRAEGRWQISGALALETLPDERFHMIAFDAYSEASSPDLWSEGFLKSLLERCCEEQALLSTYAAKGRLTRALREAGFEVRRREGFAGKRHATLAVRGLDIEPS
ncbi:MAG: hypothetical protein KDB07_06430 [Planctomycetes bacterium]|nr:hypothetical protein [Planctomycetota bacterium]